MYAETEPRRALRLPQVIARVGLRRSSIYEAVARGTFPQPFKLSSRAVAWDAAEIDEWLAARKGERGAQRCSC